MLTNGGECDNILNRETINANGHRSAANAPTAYIG